MERATVSVVGYGLFGRNQLNARRDLAAKSVELAACAPYEAANSRPAIRIYG